MGFSLYDNYDSIYGFGWWSARFVEDDLQLGEELLVIVSENSLDRIARQRLADRRSWDDLAVVAVRLQCGAVLH